jgi:hypothetical protein
VVTATGLAGALLIVRRASIYAKRLQAKHPKIVGAITTLGVAVEDTDRLLFHRGSWSSVLGTVAYLGFDVLVLWGALGAVHAHPFPGFAVVIMAYIIGPLGGSIPLPASLGTVSGMTGMLILYGVPAHAALPAVMLYQAVALLVPLTGGGIAYAILRHHLGPMRPTAAKDSDRPQTETSELWADDDPGRSRARDRRGSQLRSIRR